MNPMNPSDMNPLPWHTASRQTPHRFNLRNKASSFSHQMADRIKLHRKQQIAAAIETGRDLLVVREQLETGEFEEWLQVYCRFDEKTAQRYMRFAERFGDKVEVISELPDAILYKLGARTTPKEVTSVVLAYFEAGWPLPPNEIDRLIRERKAEIYDQYVADILGCCKRS